MDSHVERPKFSSVDLLIALLVAGLSLFAYRAVLDAEFINYDDPGYVTANPNVQQGLTPESVSWAFRSMEASNWHPLTWLSHMLDCELYGLGAAGHHLSGLLFHTINGILLFFLLRMGTSSSWRSGLVAALFVCHPVHVESVAWVAERKDVLSTFFGFISLLFYFRYARDGKYLKLGCSFFFFALSLMSKPMLVTMPFLFVLLDFWPLRRLQRGNWPPLLLEKLPFLVLSVLSSIVTLIAQRQEVAAVTALPLWARVNNAAVAYVKYLGKTFWPENLAVFYPYQGALPAIVVVLCALALLAVTALVLTYRRSKPWLPLGWFWYLGTLVPVIGIVQVGVQSMADRYTYVPLIGIFIMAAWSIPARWLERNPQRTVTLAAVATVLLLLTFQAIRQVRVWTNSEILFGHALRVTKDNYIAMNNYGTALAQRGELAEAIPHFQKSIELQPGNANAHFNLGGALFQQGKNAEAKAAFAEALKYRPKYSEARTWLGRVYALQGELAEAEREFKTALQDDPTHVEAMIQLGTLMARQGNLNAALSSFGQAIKFTPDNPELRYRVGRILSEQGRINEAVAELQLALQLNPEHVGALYELGRIAASLGRNEEAKRYLNEVLRLNPDHADAQAQLQQIAK
jgi:tetratricopeptide (TPR) repeat protein